jgi:NADH-quinone oxidoreductase subunit L
MGGLRRTMRTTFLTYAVGMMALSGVPLFFAGAWTKEEVLHAASHWPPSRVPYYLLMLGVVLTAFYMTRQMFYVFFGERRTAAENAHESPGVMTIPLVVLAVCVVALSAILTPAWPWMHAYLMGEAAERDLARLFQPMVFVSLVLVGLGIGLAAFIYRNVGQTDPVAETQPALFRFLENRMWLDELYAGTIIAVSRAGARLSDWMDRYLWDGLVRGFGRIGQLFGVATANFDEHGINAGVDEATGGTRGIGRIISGWHSGQIQTYLGAVALGMLALLFIYAWLT